MRREGIVWQLPQPPLESGPLAAVHQRGRAAGHGLRGTAGIADLEVEGDRLVVGARLKQPAGRLVECVAAWLGVAAEHRPQRLLPAGAYAHPAVLQLLKPWPGREMA